jgi:hypothetical protein
MRMRRRAPALLVALVVALAAPAFAGCGGDDAPELAPRPGETETIFGFNEVITPEGGGNDLLQEIGAAFVRTPLTWASVEPNQGTRDFAKYDRIRDELATVGLRPLWVVTDAPCWAAQVAPCKVQRPMLAPAPDRFDDFAEFAVEVAERYPEAVGIEVWNEPNIPNFWRPAPDAEQYRELLAKTADAVHESGSDLPVVMAGPSPTTVEQAEEDPQKIPFVEFIEEVMGGPDAPDVDAIGTHPYSLLQDDKDPIMESVRLYDEAAAAAERAAPGKPTWVTEVGLTTAGRYEVSPRVQAEGLSLILADFKERGIPVVAVHRFFDQADPEFRFEAGFGVVEADRTTRKPSFCSIAETFGVDCEA